MKPERRMHVSEPDVDIRIDQIDNSQQEPTSSTRHHGNHGIYGNHSIRGPKVSDADMDVRIDHHEIGGVAKEAHDVTAGVNDYGYETGVDITVHRSPRNHGNNGNHGNQRGRMKVSSPLPPAEPVVSTQVVMETQLTPPQRGEGDSGRGKRRAPQSPADVIDDNDDNRNINDDIRGVDADVREDADNDVRDDDVDAPDSPVISPTPSRTPRSAPGAAPRLQLSSGRIQQQRRQAKLRRASPPQDTVEDPQEEPEQEEPQHSVVPAKPPVVKERKFFRSKNPLPMATVPKRPTESAEIPADKAYKRKRRGGKKAEQNTDNFQNTVKSMLQKPKPAGKKATSENTGASMVNKPSTSSSNADSGKQGLKPASFYSKQKKPATVQIDPYALEFDDDATTVAMSGFNRRAKQVSSPGSSQHSLSGFSVIDKVCSEMNKQKRKPAKSARQRMIEETSAGNKKRGRKSAKKETAAKPKPPARSRKNNKKNATQNPKPERFLTRPVRPSVEDEVMSECSQRSTNSYVLSDCSVSLQPLTPQVIEKFTRKRPTPKPTVPTFDVSDFEDPACSQWTLSQFSLPSQAEPRSTRSRTGAKVQQKQPEVHESDDDMDFTLSQSQNFDTTIGDLDETREEPEVRSELPVPTQHSLSHCDDVTSSAEPGSSGESRNDVTKDDVDNDDITSNVMSSVASLKRDFLSRCVTKERQTAETLRNLAGRQEAAVREAVTAMFRENADSNRVARAAMARALGEALAEMEERAAGRDQRFRSLQRLMRRDAEEMRQRREEEAGSRQKVCEIVREWKERSGRADTELVAGLDTLRENMRREGARFRNALIKQMQEREMKVIRRHIQAQLMSLIN